MNRRRFLGLIPAAGVAFAAPNTIAEDDPKNIKICHRINARQISDDDLLFLKQIGLRYARSSLELRTLPFDKSACDSGTVCAIRYPYSVGSALLVSLH